MISSITRFICGLVLFQVSGTVTGLPRSTVPSYFQEQAFTRRGLSVAVICRELGHLLSNGTIIFGPSAPGFDEAVERWNIDTEPDVEVVVQPAKESDVSKIVGVTNSYPLHQKLPAHRSPTGQIL